MGFILLYRSVSIAESGIIDDGKTARPFGTWLPIDFIGSDFDGLALRLIIEMIIPPWYNKLEPLPAFLT
jgi:hypothetical protein